MSDVLKQTLTKLCFPFPHLLLLLTGCTYRSEQYCSQEEKLGWSQSQQTLVKRQGSLWMVCQFITGLTQRDMQPHELPILHVANQESTGNLTFLPLDCVKTPTSYSGEAAKIGQNKTDNDGLVRFGYRWGFFPFWCYKRGMIFSLFGRCNYFAKAMEALILQNRPHLKLSSDVILCKNWDKT